MVNWEKINQSKSLKELLQAYFPLEQYEWTKKIVLDKEFLTRAKRWSGATLDFSPYKDLEIIMVASRVTGDIFKVAEYAEGEIRKINVSRNKHLKELIMPNQELEGILDLSANPELEKINIANNLLNEVRVHSKFSQKLKELDSRHLQPQKHNKNKIHLVKDVAIILLDMSEPQKHKQQKLEINEKSIKELSEEKKKELLQLKTKLESKLENGWQSSHLETLLISQEQITRLQGFSPQLISSSEKQFNKAQEKLKNKLSEMEIKKICQIKVELTKLEIELDDLQTAETEAKIKINNATL